MLVILIPLSFSSSVAGSLNNFQPPEVLKATQSRYTRKNLCGFPPVSTSVLTPALFIGPLKNRPASSWTKSRPAKFLISGSIQEFSSKNSFMDSNYKLVSCENQKTVSNNRLFVTQLVCNCYT